MLSLLTLLLLSTVSIPSSQGGSLDLVVNTPSGANAVYTCDIITFYWTETTGPYELAVELNSTSDGSDVQYISKLDYTNRTCSYWNVNVAPYTILFFTVTDHITDVAKSALYNVEPGEDQSCVGIKDAPVPSNYDCDGLGSTSSSSPSASAIADASSSSSSGLSHGAKIGVIVGSVLAFIILVIMAVMLTHFYNRRRRIAASSQWVSSIAGGKVDGKPIKLEDFGYGQFAIGEGDESGFGGTGRVHGEVPQRPRIPHIRQNSLNVLPVGVTGTGEKSGF